MRFCAMSENPSPLSPSPKKREEWRVGGREERRGKEWRKNRIDL
jgi:hypothetical protein